MPLSNYKAKVPKGSHRMPNGTIMKDSDMKKKSAKKSPKKDDEPFGDLKKGAFTRQMKTFGYSDVQKFADAVLKKDVGQMLKGKKVTKLLKQRAQFVVNARSFNK